MSGRPIGRLARLLHTPIPFAGRADAPRGGPRRHDAVRPAGEGPDRADRDDEVAAYLALSQALDHYTGTTYDLLTDVGNALGVTIAYVDRASVEAYLDTDLDPQQWAAITDTTQAMDFDRWIGDSSSERGEFITHQLRRARELHPDVALPEVTPW
jgi:hypothetical protein